MRGLSLQLPIVSAKNSAAIVGQCWLPIAATWAGAAAALRGGIEVIGLRVPAVADWWSRCYSDPQVRRRRLSEVLLLAGFELLHAGLELLDLMPQGCEIACHRLKQLGRISRCGGRHDGFRCDLNRGAAGGAAFGRSASRAGPPGCAGSSGDSDEVSTSCVPNLVIFFLATSP